MADFDNLQQPAGTILMVKLDGHIEACVALAQIQGIGLGEALELTAQALLREMHARGIGRDRATAIVGNARDRVWPSEKRSVLNLN